MITNPSHRLKDRPQRVPHQLLWSLKLGLVVAILLGPPGIVIVHGSNLRTHSEIMSRDVQEILAAPDKPLTSPPSQIINQGEPQLIHDRLYLLVVHPNVHPAPTPDAIQQALQSQLRLPNSVLPIPIPVESITEVGTNNRSNNPSREKELQEESRQWVKVHAAVLGALIGWIVGTLAMQIYLSIR